MSRTNTSRSEHLSDARLALITALQRHYVLNSHCVGYLAHSVYDSATKHSVEELSDRLDHLLLKAKVSFSRPIAYHLGHGASCKVLFTC
jgi:hypothetical protein